MAPWHWRPTLWRALLDRARLAWRLVREPQVPTVVKGLPLLVVGYLISPLDVIPDTLPLVGELDEHLGRDVGRVGRRVVVEHARELRRGEHGGPRVGGG
mgnify:CR=1 FL=1